ncbi:MAG TPA: ATP-binding protein [Bacteroidia bacterium]|nr:ATP-binding protein [Bacteroidia bacterium]
MQSQANSTPTVPHHSPSQLPAEIRNLYSHANAQSCLALASSLSGMSRMDQYIEGLKGIWNISDEVFVDMRVALCEAVSNAILHGNEPVAGRYVYIRAVRGDSWFTFSVEDEGHGFDMQDVRDPLVPENLEEPNGRGIMIMRHLADRVYYSPKGNCVWFMFHRGAN